MSLEDFKDKIDHVINSGNDPEAHAWLYEEFIRYIARGGANAHHACKVARMIMRELDLPNKPFKT